MDFGTKFPPKNTIRPPQNLLKTMKDLTSRWFKSGNRDNEWKNVHLENFKSLRQDFTVQRVGSATSNPNMSIVELEFAVWALLINADAALEVGDLGQFVAPLAHVPSLLDQWRQATGQALSLELEVIGWLCVCQRLTMILLRSKEGLSEAQQEDVLMLRASGMLSNIEKSLHQLQAKEDNKETADGDATVHADLSKPPARSSPRATGKVAAESTPKLLADEVHFAHKFLSKVRNWMLTKRYSKLIQMGANVNTTAGIKHSHMADVETNAWDHASHAVRTHGNHKSIRFLVGMMTYKWTSELVKAYSAKLRAEVVRALMHTTNVLNVKDLLRLTYFPTVLPPSAALTPQSDPLPPRPSSAAKALISAKGLDDNDGTSPTDPTALPLRTANVRHTFFAQNHHHPKPVSRNTTQPPMDALQEIAWKRWRRSCEAVFEATPLVAPAAASTSPALEVVGAKAALVTLLESAMDVDGDSKNMSFSGLSFVGSLAGKGQLCLRKGAGETAVVVRDVSLRNVETQMWIVDESDRLDTWVVEFVKAPLALQGNALYEQRVKDGERRVSRTKQLMHMYAYDPEKRAAAAEKTAQPKKKLGKSSSGLNISLDDVIKRKK